MIDYIAKIKPINADKIETQAHGIATFSENGNSLHIHVEMFDTPANIEHWEHFHGFPDGKQAHVPTLMQDVNHDGFIDLPETKAVSGTTMVPFDDAPHNNHEWHPSLCSSLYFVQRKLSSCALDSAPTDHSILLFAFHSQCKSRVYG